jgi:large subunit ribosomal protein L9
MEVILKEDVANLGHRGDVVKVADGYGRNFCCPASWRCRPPMANKAVIEQMKTAAARRSATRRSRPRNWSPSSSRRAQLHPQVGRGRPPLRLRHLGRHRRRAGTKGFEVDRRKIQLEPSRSRAVGEVTVAIKLHREVTAHVKVKVLAEAGRSAA